MSATSRHLSRALLLALALTTPCTLPPCAAILAPSRKWVLLLALLLTLAPLSLPHAPSHLAQLFLPRAASRHLSCALLLPLAPLSPPHAPSHFAQLLLPQAASWHLSCALLLTLAPLSLLHAPSRLAQLLLPQVHHRQPAILRQPVCEHQPAGEQQLRENQGCASTPSSRFLTV